VAKLNGFMQVFISYSAFSEKVFIYLFLKNPKKKTPQERTARIKETGRLTEGSKRLFILKAISWAQKRGSHSQICCSRSLGGDQLVDSC
jgi:hypothetical protein